MPEPTIWELHDAACERGDFTYQDPETGYVVFTRLGLLQREQCCGAGCRHCPFGHERVKLGSRAAKIQQAAWLSDARPEPGREIAVLFWSGGKDSYLAYRALSKEADVAAVLLTTFDARTRAIAHQDIPIEEVVAQAAHLGAPLIGVPLHPGADYMEQIIPALDLVPDCKRLCFGDLHLRHIREWREEAFATHPKTAEMELSFPLWGADYETLINEFEASGARSTISAIAADLPGVAIGDCFDRALIERLPENVDPFGENGEFHTRIVFD